MGMYSMDCAQRSLIFFFERLEGLRCLNSFLFADWLDWVYMDISLDHQTPVRIAIANIIISLPRLSLVQLLHKLSIRAINSPEKLLKVIKNPITDHLPPNARKITLSSDAPVVQLKDYIMTLPSDEPIVFFVGAMAHGVDNFADDHVDDKISVSQYSLSASVTCGKLCCAFEEVWGVL